MHDLIIDTDPGHDDAIAILLALAYPEACTLRAVTTVAGNQTIEKVTTNALKILSLAGRRIPVAAGARQPLMQPLEVGASVHGESGLDGPALPPPAFEAENGGAQALLAAVLESADQPITLVPIGPQTNVAVLFRERPELKQKVRLISMMGGGLAGGNITMAAEFNIYTDPEAAQEVFAAGIPIAMSGLDVTLRAYMAEKEIEELRRRGRASLLVSELLTFYGTHYRRIGMPGPALHDPCSIAYLIRPELFRYEDLYVAVETKGELTRGMTVADRRSSPERPANARVLLDVDRPAFIELLFDGLARLDREIG